MQATIDKSGRMVLPKAIRDDFDLVPGTVLQVEESQEVIVLRPIRGQQPVKQREGLLVFCGEPTERLEEAVAKHRKERLESLSTKGMG